MSYGSNEAVEQEEEESREQDAKRIAVDAAELVAAGDMSRSDAVAKVVESLRMAREAEGDETGVLAVEIDSPSPSKVVKSQQVAAIAADLMEAARAAADTL